MSEKNFFSLISRFFLESVKDDMKIYLRYLYNCLRIIIPSSILIYLILKFVFKIDIFYITGIPFLMLFSSFGIIFISIAIIMIFVAFILYNTEYTRPNKYKNKKRK